MPRCEIQDLIAAKAVSSPPGTLDVEEDKFESASARKHLASPPSQDEEDFHSFFKLSPSLEKSRRGRKPSECVEYEERIREKIAKLRERVADCTDRNAARKLRNQISAYESRI